MSATEWKFVPVEPTREMLVAALKTNGACPIYAAMLDAAPVPPSVESLLENWTPSDQQAFAKFRDEHFPGEISSYAIQSLGSAWKNGQDNAAQPAAHLTIPGALEWDGDNGTHGVVGTHSADGESDFDDAKEAVAEIERTGAPGDVIREMNDELVDLRAQLDDYKSKWLANCEALKLLGIHARHAEKLVKSCREKLEVGSVGKGFIEALDGFIGAAISKEAQP